MKLYQLPRNTRFTIKDDDSKTKYTLDHIDGAYSYCTSSFNDDVYHFSANMEVELVEVQDVN